MTYKNKGGAPKKEITQDREIKFSCTQEVYDFLVEQAKIAGFATSKRSNVSAFLRHFLLEMIQNGRYEVIKPGEVSIELLKELIMVGINLNQAMRAMNTFHTEVDMINVITAVDATRKLLYTMTESITAPQRFNQKIQG